MDKVENIRRQLAICGNRQQKFVNASKIYNKPSIIKRVQLYHEENSINVWTDFYSNYKL